MKIWRMDCEPSQNQGTGCILPVALTQAYTPLQFNLLHFLLIRCVTYYIFILQS